MRLMLVNMPWQWLQMPSISIGILRARASETIPDIEVQDYYANLRWSDYLLEHSEGELTPTQYEEIADIGMFHGIGDWVFASAVYDDDNWKSDEFSTYVRATGMSGLAEIARMARPYVKPFLKDVVADVLEWNPAVVGLTTSFSQTMPALAAARLLKSVAPNVVTVLGGSNCEGTMGAALHRNFSFIDFVVRGEGERTFPQLLTELSKPAIDDYALSSIPGLCWWSDADGMRVSKENVPSGAFVPVSEIPAPDYTGWADAFDGSMTSEYVEPRLLLETSRGCWWGETHHCTFCGLNGSLMKYRAKDADRIWTEIQDLVRRHQILDLVTVDNIMDLTLLSTLMPRLEEAGWDLRIHYEIKSNLKTHELLQLRNSGVVHIQPGIESLSTHVLSLMRKGVHATQNVRLLRDAEELGLTTSWNYLYGFPGETEEDYTHVFAQIRNLYHLQPPNFTVRLAVERFSPYFTDVSLGFHPERAGRHYYHLFDLPDDEMHDLAYAFDAEELGINGAMVLRLEEYIDEWKLAYACSSLRLDEEDGALVISDSRQHRPACTHVIEDPLLVTAFTGMARPRSETAVLGELTKDAGLSKSAARNWLNDLKEAGLVYHEGGRVVSLPSRGTAIRVQRVVGP